MADQPNYMFHGNLETIKRIIDEMVQLDPQEVSQILNDGHEWAEDHIATSLDDIQEVHNFLKSRLSVRMDHQHSHHDHHEHDHKKDMGDFLQSFESFTFKR